MLRTGGSSMYCRVCGRPRTDAGDFCPTCGTRFAGAERSRRRAVVLGTAGALVLAVAVAALVVVLSRGDGTTPRAGAGSSGTPTVGGPSASPTPTASPSPSPTAASFEGLYRDTSDGVVRIETTACDGGGVGSGFLVAPDLVATVAHVVDGAVSIVLRQGDSSSTGVVVGYDRAAELALVRSSVPLTGHVFTLGTSVPEVGTDVAAIGYPLAGDESFTRGTVSGLDRPVETEGASLSGLIQTDTPINPGNSGGPLLLPDGTVVGLVEAKSTEGEAIGFAIPTATARTTLQAWQDDPVEVAATEECEAPEGPDELGEVVTDSTGSTDGPDLATAFSTYADGINTGDYDAAFDVFSPAAQERIGRDAFEEGTTSSYVVRLDLLDVSERADGGVDVDASLTTLQDAQHGKDGQLCSDWEMTYRMLPSASGWRLDAATPAAGSPTAC